jgi:putative addiction module component (TIGR02574 family)
MLERMAKRDLLPELLALPKKERERLAGALITSLAGVPELGLSAKSYREVLRRSAEVHAGTAELVSLEDHRAKMRRVLRPMRR